MKALLSSVERLTITTKLMIGFSTGILVALAIGLNALSGLSALETEMERMYENDLLGISHIKDANLNLIYMSRAMRHMLIAQDQVVRDAASAQIKRARETMLFELAEARKRIYRPEMIERFNVFQADLNKALEGIEHAVALIRVEEMRSSAAARYITSPEFAAAIAKADHGLHDLVELKERTANASLDQARLASYQVKLHSIILLAAGIIVAVLVGMVIGLSIQRPNDRLRGAVEELAAGNVDAAIPHKDYPNEVGVMARAIGVLQNIYRRANEQHWVKSNLAEVSAVLQQAGDFSELTQAAVSKVAQAIGAGHGAFYVADRDGRYNLLASYGYRERKHLSNSYLAGEGLVGQCVLERSTIMLTAPQNYIRINSGLGEGPPACVIVLPIIHGNRVLGVLELASFQQFTDRERAVMDGLLPALSASMEILDRNLRTKELLAATQEQAERMEKQAAQLEEQQVEMEAQQVELLETENWFRSIIETAPDGMLVTDAKGRILLTNPRAEAIFGYEAGELIGTLFCQLVPVRLQGGQGGVSEQVLADHASRVMEGGADIVGLRKDGDEFPMTIVFNSLPPRGNRGRCISVSVRVQAVS